MELSGKNGKKDSSYEAFLNYKIQLADMGGFTPLSLPEFLYPFQAYLLDWSVRKGRAAIWADCGLGKTPLSLSFADNIIRKTNKDVLILTPLSVAGQFVREGEKFGIPCKKVREGNKHKGINVTNYEQLGYYSPRDFGAVIADESGILKSFSGKIRSEVIKFMRNIPYRLLCTATAAPNDYDELGNSSEALGDLRYKDMVASYFRKQLADGGETGWSKAKLLLRKHAEKPFWKWICSWARACRKPSDLGFDDGPFILPELKVEQHKVHTRHLPNGRLVDFDAVTLQEQREEQRRTLSERCEMAVELVKAHDSSIVWCNLNDEGDMLERIIPGSRQVSGATTEDEREEIIEWFTGKGEGRKVLVSKPRLFGFGLNLQCCAHQTFFPSHSWEAWYQAVRRSWRFGQKRPVTIDVIATDGAYNIMSNLRRKAEQAEKMFTQLVSLMKDYQDSDNSYGNERMRSPSWLS